MNISLLKETGCNKIFYAQESSLQIQALKADFNELESFTVEGFEDMLRGQSKPYPYEVTFAEARWDPVLVLHSSGSTGKSLLSTAKRRHKLNILRTSETDCNKPRHVGGH